MTTPVPLTRATRTSVMLSAELFRVDRPTASQHRVTNISETGICIAQAGDLENGTVVVVSLGRIEHAAADVVWVRSGLAGLRFQTPIDVAQARLRRATDRVVPPPAAGWLTDLNNPYRG